MDSYTTIANTDAASRAEAVLAAVARWPAVRIAAGPSGGREIRLGGRQVGLVRYGGTVAVTYPRALRDPLVAAGWTAPDPVAPASGRTVFRVRNRADVDRAVALLRLSYLFHALDRPDAPESVAALASIDPDADLAALAPPRAVRTYLSGLAANARGGRSGLEGSSPDAGPVGGA